MLLRLDLPTEAAVDALAAVWHTERVDAIRAALQNVASREYPEAYARELARAKKRRAAAATE